MRRQYSAHHHLQSKRYQYDLFAQPVRGVTALGPEWRTLPAETRQALTKLMVRLILGHMHGACQVDQKEARHDN
jgi:hypothetical protein